MFLSPTMLSPVCKAVKVVPCITTRGATDTDHPVHGALSQWPCYKVAVKIVPTLLGYSQD